jgi:antitoxin component YwqK of YwqJK toxin-antitoxin module
MQFTHAMSLQVVVTEDTYGYIEQYTINSAGQKHGVEYVYYPDSTDYCRISHYKNGEPSGPSMYFDRSGVITQIAHIVSPWGQNPTVDEVRTYTVVLDEYD